MLSLCCKRLQLLCSSKGLIVAKNFSSVEVVSCDNGKQEKDQSFTLSYLINSCGLSPENARYLSKRIHFKTPEKPDSVICFLRQHGFTYAQISKLVKKHPRLLLSRVEENLLPKLQFFASVGFSGAELANILSANPTLLIRSLDKQIIPNYNLLNSLLSDKAKIVNVLTRSLHFYDVQKRLPPNISTLKGVGVKQAAILSLLNSNPDVLSENFEKFNENVKKAIDLGFIPSEVTFRNALIAVASSTEETRAQKMEALRNWGWSEEEFLNAFSKYPRFVAFSLENINSKMDFIVNKMGWKPSEVARNPSIMGYSLDKRLIPRCSVVKLLQLKGFLKQEFSLSSVVMSSDKYILDTFVSKYKEQAPEIQDVYQGKVGLPELDLLFEKSSGSEGS